MAQLEKIMSIYYGTDKLPYKDEDRQTHYPIAGETNTFVGENNTTKVRFYVDRIGGSNYTWVAKVKKPNGTICYRVLEMDNDDYVDVDLSFLYTDQVGQIDLALNGYTAQDITITEDDGVYEISGNPIVICTGIVKIIINYSPLILNMGASVQPSEYQMILGMLNQLNNQKADLSYVNEFTILNGIIKSNNILDETYFIYGQYMLPTGEVNNASFVRTDYVRVKPNTQYTRNNGYNLYCYTEDKVFIETINGSTMTFTTPSNCYYIITYALITDTVMKLGEGVVAPTDNYFIYKKSVSLDPNKFAEELKNVNEQKSLIQPEDFIQGGYLAGSGTVSGTNQVAWQHTRYIEIKPNTNYKARIYSNIFIYNENYGFEQQIPHNNGNVVTFKTNANAKFLRVTAYMNYINNTFLYESTLAPNTIPTTHRQEANQQAPIYFVANNQDVDFYFRTIVDDLENNYVYQVLGNSAFEYYGKMKEKGQFTISVNASTPSNSEWFVQAKDNNGNFKAFGSQKAKYVPLNAGNGITKKVMFIGDSTTDNNYFVPSVLNFFSTDAMSISCIGNRGTSPTKHCGISGASLTYFYENQNSPFYDETDEKFNFQTGLTRYSLETPDIVIINLGINDIFGTFVSQEFFEEKATDYLNKLQYIINSIHSVNSNIVIGICITTPPSRDRNGWSKSYTNGAKSWLVYYNGWKYLCNKLENYIDTDEMKTNHIYTIGYCNALDDMYGYPTEQAKPFVLSSETITTATNGVHPSEDGYKQIAYQAYAFIKWTTTLS